MKTVIYYAHRAYRSGSVVRHSQLIHSGRGSLFCNMLSGVSDGRLEQGWDEGMEPLESSLPHMPRVDGA